MNGDLETKLNEIFRAIEILSPLEFSFCDRTIQAKARPPGQPDAGDAPDDDGLLTELKYALYLHCYARPFDGTIPDSINAILYRPDPEYVERLRAANHTRFRWDPGWRIYRLGLDGEVQVNKGERHRSPIPGEYAFHAGPGLRPQVGDEVSLIVLPESQRLSQIFYFCFSDVLPDQFDGFSTIRFYFNCTPDGAVALVDFLSRELNQLQIPFRLKCLNERANFDRRDSAVLYIAKRYFHVAGRLLSQLPASVASQLEPGVPLFCKTVATGIGLAEDPGWNTSFGLHRCTILANAILDAWRQGRQDSATRLHLFTQRLDADGLSFERPYLNAGSVDFFELPEEVGIDA